MSAPSARSKEDTTKPTERTVAAVGHSTPGWCSRGAWKRWRGRPGRCCPPGRLIDVGCGDGSIACRIGELRDDVLPEAYDVLIRPTSHIPVTQFDGRNIPLPDD